MGATPKKLVCSRRRPGELAAVVRRLYRLDLSDAEIADRLGITPGAVYVARKRMGLPTRWPYTRSGSQAGIAGWVIRQSDPAKAVRWDAKGNFARAT